jgi:hypothetical protein
MYVVIIRIKRIIGKTYSVLLRFKIMRDIGTSFLKNHPNVILVLNRYKNASTFDQSIGKSLSKGSMAENMPETAKIIYLNLSRKYSTFKNIQIR